MSEIVFREEDHTYWLDGAQLPSVTSLLKPIVTAGGSEETRDFKRQIGKALDTAITLNERNDLDVDSLDEAVLPFFQAWLKFKAESGFRVLVNQLVVYSRKLRYAGTLDLLGTRNPGTATPDELIDTKCTWAIDPATGPQTAAYSMAAAESHGLKVKRRGAVQLLRDATYRYYQFSDLNDANVFRALLSIHSWKALQK